MKPIPAASWHALQAVAASANTDAAALRSRPRTAICNRGSVDLAKSCASCSTFALPFQRDDLRFDTWRAHVDRHHLGIQLRIRHAGYRLFYGEGRATIERVLPVVRGLLEAGVQDFAGRPLSKLSLLRGAGQLAWALAKVSAEPT